MVLEQLTLVSPGAMLELTRVITEQFDQITQSNLTDFLAEKTGLSNQAGCLASWMPCWTLNQRKLTG